MPKSKDPADQNPASVTRVSNRFDGDDARVTEAMKVYLAELEAGQTPNRALFLAKFPEIATELEEQLDGLDLLHGVAIQAAPEADESNPGVAGAKSTQADLGDFRLIRELGRGGMGVVYEAVQLSLGRRVAVKVLPFAAMLNQQHRKRFHNEARAAATLDHPHIVPIYSVGQERGVHFFAMLLIDGQSLAEVIEGLRGEQTGDHAGVAGGRASASPQQDDSSRDETGGSTFVNLTSRPQPPNQESGAGDTQPNFLSKVSTARCDDRAGFFRTVARLGSEAAEALEHAHSVGILHRDIKPGNLLVDVSGKLWVADFGLATIEHDETMTRTGGVVGTAAYMSPEQASDSHAIDGRSDVYSLGATLYELLTLHRHRADNATHLSMSSHRQPEVIARIETDSTIPVDLETIVIKALSFDSADRYQSAAAMAVDLRCFIDGQEIRARRLTLLQRQARWLLRHRRLTAGAIAAGFLLLAAFGSAMVVYSQQLSRHGEQLAAALDKATIAQAEAEKSEQDAKESELFARRMSYRTDTQRAYEQFSQHNYFGAKQSLQKQVPANGEPDLRGIEWQLLTAELDAKFCMLGLHRGEATQSVAYPDGKTVATVGEDGAVHLWDIASRKKLKTLEPNIGPIHAMDLSPDGKTLAVGGKPSLANFDRATVYLLDANSGDILKTMQRHKTTIESIRFSPDGKLIAAGSRYQSVQLSTVDGKFLHAFPADRRNEAIVFSPDSQFLAAEVVNESNDSLIRIWNCDTGIVRNDINFKHSIGTLNWQADGDYIAATAGGFPFFNAYDAQSGRRQAYFNCLGISPDSFPAVCLSSRLPTIAGGDTDGKIWEWARDPASWRKHLKARRKPPGIDSVPRRITMDNEAVASVLVLDELRSYVTAHKSGRVAVATPTTSAARSHTFDFIMSAAVPESDSSLLIAATDGSIRRMSLVSGMVNEVSAGFGEAFVDLEMAADAPIVVAVCGSGRMQIINVDSGEILWSYQERQNDPNSNLKAAVSPDGRFVARSATNGKLTIWDTDKNESVFKVSLLGEPGPVVFSPDGELVAYGNDELVVCQVDSWKKLHRVRTPSFRDLQFSRDGEYLISGHTEGSVRILNLGSGEQRVLRGLANTIQSMDLSENGRTILADRAGPKRGAIQLWDLDSGEPYGLLPIPQKNPVFTTHVTRTHFAVSSSTKSRSYVLVWDLPVKDDTKFGEVTQAK